MANSPTIVAASLSDQDLKNSINKLVQHVDEATKRMAGSMDSAVEQMKKKIGELGNVKIDFGGTSSGSGTKKVANDQKELEEQTKKTTQAVKEQGQATKELTLDQQQNAIKAAQVSSKDFYSYIKSQNEEIRRWLNEPFPQAYGNQAINRIVEDFRNLSPRIKQEIERVRAEMEKSMQLPFKGGDYGLILRRQLNNELNTYESALQRVASRERSTSQITENSLDRQLQKIKEIASRKEAMLALKTISSMESSDLDKAQAKLDALRALKEKVKNTDLLTKQGAGELESWLTYTTSLVERLGGAVSKNAQKNSSSIDSINERIKKNIQLEEQRRQSTVQYGLEAQETYRKLLNILKKQAEESGGKTAIGKDAENNINYIAQLEEAIKSMRRAYYDMDASQKESPLGKQLLEDIKTAQKLRNEVDKFNRGVAGIERPSDGKLNVDKNIGSYERLSNLLKELTAQYRQMGREERNAESGADLAGKIQRTTRAMQKAQQQMNRPVNLDAALKGSEKTLDDIAYKMQRLQLYRQGIDLTKKGAADEIKQVDDKLQQLQKDADKWMGKQRSMIEGNNALGRSWNYMKNRLAFYFTVGASTQFIKNLIEVRSQYEMNERALGILINSAERGTQIFNELSQMALVSPYTLIELSNAAKQLTAYDIAAKDVVDTTRRLADMASAVGVPMERLTYALGQIKAYGYLNSRDARMFANAGIPLVRELSKYYTELEGKMVSVGDVYDRMKKKAIDYNDVMSVVTKMTDEGGKFFDFQAKMADTLKVRLANLTLAWNNMLNDIGKSEQGVLTTGIGLLKEFFLQWKNLSRAVENIAIGFGLVKAAQLLYYGVVMGTNKAIALEAVLGDKLSQKLRALTSSMNAARMASTTLWVGLATMAAAAIVEILRGNEAMMEFNKTLRENAKNTYNDLEKFKEQYKELRESLYQTITDNNGKTIVTPQDINVDDAKKAWEAVKEQIELSSHASDKYIGGLLQIKNISERLRQSFAVIDDIQSVSAAIKELGDSAIKLERDWSAWWNLWTLPDGTIGNLKDTHMWLGKIEEKYGSIEKARKAASGEDKAPLGIDKKYQDDAERWLENYENELKKFREDLESTKESVLNFINAQGWSGNVNKVNETFKQITDNLIQQNQLDPEKAYMLQIEMEEARSKAAKEAQYIRLQDLRNAYMAEKDSLHKEEIAKEYEKEAEIYNNWNLYNGRQKVEWERFTKYLKEQHLSEMTAMFRGMNDEQIKSLNFQEGKYADWVKRMVTNYAKSHKMSYDEAFNYLKNWVASANQWSIFIPLTISTDENKTVMKTLEEADAAADKAWKDMQRLDKEIARLRKKGAKEVDENNITASKDDQKLTKALKERAAAEKDYNKAVSEGGESKKENTANTKAQKAAESELQKALKEELKIIDEVSSAYKKMTDSGINRTTALSYLTSRFGESIEYINKILGKNNIPKFDIRKFAGTDDPNKLLKMLQEQISAAKLSKNVKPEEISELRIKYDNVDVDAKSYNATKIKKGLDNELGRLKDEYELAVELDANPELGNMFADMFDIDLDTLPRTAKEYADRYTKSLNKYFKKMGANIELPNMLNLTRDEMMAFQQQVDDNQLQQVYFDMIQKGFDATHDALKKEISGEIKEYDKLLQKYSEYQYKLTQIAKEANNERKALVVKFGTDEQKERARKIYAQLEVEDDPQKADELKRRLIALVDQVVGDDQVKVQLKVAIDKEEAEKSAKASFEEFQKSPEWITATGNLAGLTDKALKGLIDTIDEYKKKAKNLSPKQIKEINKALVNLEKERKKNNPFKLMSISVMEAKERMEQFDEEIKNVEEEIDALSNAQDKDNMEEIGKKITTLTDRLRKLKKAREEAGKIDASEIVSNVNAMVSSIGQAIQMVDGLLTALNGKKWSEAQELMNDTFSVIEKGGQGAAMGAQIGGGYGAIIGAAAGVITGLITSLSDNANKKIDAMVEESVVAVKRLELAYVDLEHAIDNAYGTGVVGSKRLLASMKQLELAELEQQLLLEQSRSYKNRDEGAIADLQKRIKELRYEISDTVTEITNDLLGSDVGSFAENLVSSMIDAFKQGEDYMKVFEEKFDDMIDNMIMKSIVSKVVAQYMDALWNDMDARISNRARQESDALAAATKRREELEAMDWNAYAMSEGLNPMGNSLSYIKDQLEQARENARAAEERAKKAYEAASEMSDSDIDFLFGELADIKPQLSEKLKDILGEYYKFGEATTPELSSLQQGIQSITETTANSLEAYMNGVSQQAYLRNDYLRQIVEIMTMQSALTDDAKVATLSQILLQLQTNYTVMMSMQSMMEGWSVPSGQGIRVALIS